LAQEERLKIDRIEILVTDLPIRIQRLSSSGTYDTGAMGSLLGKPVMVRIFAEGVVGTGQIRPIAPSHFLPDTGAGMVAAIRDIYAPRMIGRSIFDLEGIIAEFDRTLPGNVQARAAVDHALHDAMGKALNQPVYNLLGGRCYDRIPLEWSVGMHHDISGMIEECQLAIDKYGIGTLCLKAGHPKGWQEDVKNFIAVRKVVGETITIGMDPNTGWSVSEARQALHALHDYRLDYLEQPVARGNFAGLAAIRADSRGVPLMADESLLSLEDAHKLATMQAVDVFCIKLYKFGGMHNAKKVAAVAEAADIKVNIGGIAAFSQLEAAAGIHFHTAMHPSKVMPAGEFLFGLGVRGPDPLVPEPTYSIVDGHVEPSSLPGLGVTLDESAITRLTLVREVVSA
jgi:L-alanine-DL-glutamate epimerase-like enolase superfamily enzyme